MPNEAMRRKNMSRALETAYSCFLREGIRSVTRSEISRKSGVSLSSLGRYWKSTDDCVLRTAEWFCRRMKSLRDEQCSVRSWREKSGIEQLRSHMEWCRDLYLREPGLFALLAEFRVFLYRSAELSDGDCERFARMLSIGPAVARIRERGVLDGSIRPPRAGDPDPVFLIRSFICCLSGLSLRPEHDPAAETAEIDRYIESVILLFQK